MMREEHPTLQLRRSSEQFSSGAQAPYRDMLAHSEDRKRTVLRMQIEPCTTGMPTAEASLSI